MITFRWRSWLGASVILFLLFGAANVLAALVVPTTLIRGGAGATAVVLDPDSDAYLAGGKQIINALRHDNPKLDTLLVSSMVSMCSQMMAFAIVAILVTWFAIRRGQTWGLWAVTAAALAEVPYYVAITTMYAAQGAPIGGGVAGLFPFYVWPLIALALGLVGMRRMHLSRAA
jgi:hypothetical protein